MMLGRWWYKEQNKKAFYGALLVFCLGILLPLSVSYIAGIINMPGATPSQVTESGSDDVEVPSSSFSEEDWRARLVGQYDGDGDPETVPHAIYEGGFEGPYIIDETFAGTSSVINEKAALEVLNNNIPKTIGYEFDHMEDDEEHQLDYYVFCQSYGPLKIYNSQVKVAVDFWGNWKSIEGTYVIMTGTITTDEWKDEGDEPPVLGILLTGEDETATVVRDEGKYYDCRDTGKEVYAAELEAAEAPVEVAVDDDEMSPA